MTGDPGFAVVLRFGRVKERSRQTKGFRLLLIPVLSMMAVPSLRAQSDTDFDEYKVRITGCWFYSNPGGTIEDATTGDIISLQRYRVQLLLDLLGKAGLEIHTQEPHLPG